MKLKGTWKRCHVCLIPSEDSDTYTFPDSWSISIHWTCSSADSAASTMVPWRMDVHHLIPASIMSLDCKIDSGFPPSRCWDNKNWCNTVQFNLLHCVSHLLREEADFSHHCSYKSRSVDQVDRWLLQADLSCCCLLSAGTFMPQSA